jgi:hypothetical protein
LPSFCLLLRHDHHFLLRPVFYLLLLFCYSLTPFLFFILCLSLGVESRKWESRRKAISSRRRTPSTEHSRPVVSSSAPSSCCISILNYNIFS